MSIPLLVQISRSATLSPSFRTFIARVNTLLHRAFSRQRPWPELLDLTAYSRPQSLSDATTNIRKNIAYFWTNYLTLLGGVLAFSLLSHPLSLVTLFLLASAWIFLYLFKPSEQQLILFGRTISNNEMLALLVCATVVVMLYTSVASLLISATLISGAIVCVHGAFRDPVDLFLHEQDPASSSSSSGFFSIAGGATTTSSSSAPTSAMSIV